MISIVYTNSKCNDVFDIFKNEYIKFNKLPLITISDDKGDFIYNENIPYYKRWVEPLKQISSEYFIYHQEDFILYDYVDEKKLEYCKSFLQKNQNYSFVKLIKSGINLKNNLISECLYEINKDAFPLYSMQATIWNKNKFIELYENTKNVSSFWWHEEDKYQKTCIDLNINGVYYYNNEKKRGMNHYDSTIYPYIATAVVKGKWNLSEYKNELLPLLLKHNIDINKRGVY